MMPAISWKDIDQDQCVDCNPGHDVVVQKVRMKTLDGDWR